MAFKPIIRRVDFEKQIAWIDVVEVDDDDTSIVKRTITKERLNLGTVLQSPLAPPGSWNAFAVNLMADRLTKLRDRRAADANRADAEIEELEAARDTEDSVIVQSASLRGPQ